jgi:hypothetical protein
VRAKQREIEAAQEDKSLNQIVSTAQNHRCARNQAKSKNIDWRIMSPGLNRRPACSDLTQLKKLRFVANRHPAHKSPNADADYHSPLPDKYPPCVLPMRPRVIGPNAPGNERTHVRSKPHLHIRIGNHAHPRQCSKTPRFAQSKDSPAQARPSALAAE